MGTEFATFTVSVLIHTDPEGIDEPMGEVFLHGGVFNTWKLGHVFEKKPGQWKGADNEERYPSALAAALAWAAVYNAANESSLRQYPR